MWRYLDAFERLHTDEAADYEGEEDSPLSIILKEERTNSSRAIRSAANGCLGRLMPRSYLRELGATILGSVLPGEFLDGVRNAVSAITHMYWGGAGYCPTYIEYLGYGDRSHEDERVPYHYNEEARALASISRFTNIGDAKDELRELVDILRGLMPEVVKEEELEEPRRDAPGQLYFFE